MAPRVVDVIGACWNFFVEKLKTCFFIFEKTHYLQEPSLQPSLSADYSSAAKELVGKLLVHNPAQRLGAEGESQVLEHAWFADVDLESLRKRPEKMTPWSPDLSDMTSTQYFDDWDNVLESKFSQSYPTLTSSQKILFVDF